MTLRTVLIISAAATWSACGGSLDLESPAVPEVDDFDAIQARLVEGGDRWEDVDGRRYCHRLGSWLRELRAEYREDCVEDDDVCEDRCAAKAKDWYDDCLTRTRDTDACAARARGVYSRCVDAYCDEDEDERHRGDADTCEDLAMLIRRVNRVYQRDCVDDESSDDDRRR